MINISNRWTGTMVIFTLSAILAACGGGGPAASPALTAQPTPPAGATVAPASSPTVAPTGGSAVDVCSLLTLAEVSTAYGQTLAGALAESDPNYVYCTYGDDRQVRTFLTTNASVATTIFNTMKINDGEAVAGVGDEAWWSTDSFQPGLYFMKNGVLAFISGAQTGPEAPIIALGQLLASRM